MALNWESISENIINISQVLGEFLDTNNPKDVEWVYIDNDSNIKNVKLPNLGKAIKSIQDSAVTPDELGNELKKYYKSVEVDAIKQTIYDTINKTINDKTNKVKSDLTNVIESKEASLNKRVSEVLNRANATMGFDIVEKMASKSTYPTGVVFTKYYRPEDGGDSPSSLQARAIRFRRRNVSNEENKIGYLTTETREEGYEVVSYGGQLALIPSTVQYNFNTGEAPDLIVCKSSNSIERKITKGNFVSFEDLSREWVKNGSFVSNTSGWYSRNGYGDLTYDSGKKAAVIKKNNTRFSYPILETVDNVSLIPGVEYEIRVKASNKIVRIYLRTKYDGEVSSNYYFDADGAKNQVSHSGPGVIKYDNETNEYYVRVISSPGLGAVERLLIAGQYDKNNEIVIENVSIKQVKKEVLRARGDIPVKADLFNYAGHLTMTDGYSITKLMYIDGYWEDVKKTGVIFPFGYVHYSNNHSRLGIPGGFKQVNFPGWEEYTGYGKVTNVPSIGWVLSELSEDQLNEIISYRANNLKFVNGVLKQFRQRVRIVDPGDNTYLAQRIGVSKEQGNFTPKAIVSGIISEFNTGGALNVSIYTDNGDKILGTDLQGRYSSAIFERRNGTVELSGANGARSFGSNMLFFNKTSNVTKEDRAIILLTKDVTTNINSGIGIPLAEFTMFNKGIYHPTYNPEGTAAIYYSGELKYYWEVPEDYISSTEDCFNLGLVAAITGNGSIVSAAESTAKYRTGSKASKKTGSPFGYYYDALDRTLVRDMRPISALYTTDRVKMIINDLINGNKIGVNYLPYFRKYADVNLSSSITHNGNSEIVDIKQNQLVLSRSINNSQAAEDIHCGYSAFSRFFSPSDILIKDKKSGKVNAFTQLLSASTQRYHIHMSYKGRWYTYDPAHIDYMGNRVLNDGGTRPVEISTTVSRATKVFGMEAVPFIYGDYRTIRERLEYEVTSGTDVSGVIHEGNYVGTDGKKVYRSLLYRGIINLNPKKEDYTNTQKWTEVCDYSDLDKGGYPKEWREVGVHGIPILKTLNTKPMPYLSENKNGQAFAVESLFAINTINSTYGCAIKVIAYNSYTKEHVELPCVVNNSDLNKGNRIGHYIDYRSDKIFLNPVLHKDYDSKKDDFWVFTIYKHVPTPSFGYVSNGVDIVVEGDKIYDVNGYSEINGVTLLSSLTGLSHSNNKLAASFHMADDDGQAIVSTFSGYKGTFNGFYRGSYLIKAGDSEGNPCLKGTKVMFVPFNDLKNNRF